MITARKSAKPFGGGHCSIAFCAAFLLAGTALSAGCVKVDSSPVDMAVVDVTVTSLVIQPAAQSVAPGGELALSVLATEKGGAPARDGSTITLKSDSLGTITPDVVSTINGRAGATFKAGSNVGVSTVSAFSAGGASHSLTVQIQHGAQAPPPDTTTVDKPAADPSDDLNLSDVTNFILPSTPGVSPDELRGAKVTARIRSASTNGTMLYTSYDPYRYPSRDGLDAVCYFFYRSGNTIMGGKFDWWRAGGQPGKTLENVHHGYGGHRMPARGTECWTMFSSLDGSQRSNTRKVEWQ